jgi:copper oxidase (laccase) domain-containing protein
VSAAELSFDLPGGGHVLFTTRVHGNLSSVGGVDAEHGLQARERLRGQIGVERLQRGYQVHGTTVQRVGAPAPKGQRGGEVELEARTETDLQPDSTAQPDVEADGQATDLHGLGALVLTADCLPVALGGGGAVAIVHAGWRGTRSAMRSTRRSAVRTVSRARPRAIST